VRSVAEGDVVENDRGAVGWPGCWGLDFAFLFVGKVEELDDTFCGVRDQCVERDEEGILRTNRDEVELDSTILLGGISNNYSCWENIYILYTSYASHTQILMLRQAQMQSSQARGQNKLQ